MAELTEINITSILFLSLLFVVAFLYSGVGHGGASGYLALMGLYHLSPDVMKPAALMMNICVSFVSFTQYKNAAKLNKKLFLWLILGSFPAAFLGAQIHIDASIYKKILAVLLVLPAIRLLGFPLKEKKEQTDVNIYLCLLIGVVLGFISGLIGIGGGIMLSPLLLFLGWTNMKETALMSSLFIVLNSVSGMAGLIQKGVQIHPVFFVWIAICIAGGFTGAYLGSRKFNNSVLKKLLGIVLIIAGGKLFFD